MIAKTGRTHVKKGIAVADSALHPWRDLITVLLEPTEEGGNLTTVESSQQDS